MTKKRDLKVLVRKRMEKTGESYAAARRHIEDKSATLQETGRATYMTKAPIEGWFVMGSNPDEYEIAIDNTQGHDTPSSALIRSRRDSAIHSSTMLRQHFLAHDYRGQRVRFSAWIKCEAVTGLARLWMRLDENTRLLLFHYASPVTGTCEWTRRELVFDIAEETTLISIGFQLDGAGAAWLADVAFDVVDRDVPATHSRQLPSRPRNLSFSE
jgi:hypothetical protein